MLVVLVGLNGDAGQRGIADDVVRFAQIAVAGGKAAAEEVDQIDLTAGRGQRQKVHVVDVDVAAVVRAGVLGFEDEQLVEFLRAFGAVAQHRAHGAVAVDVGVFTLDVAVGGLFVGDVVVYAHQAAVFLALAAAAQVIGGIAVGNVVEARSFEHRKDGFINRIDVHAFRARQGVGDGVGQLGNVGFAGGAAAVMKGSGNGFSDFFRLESSLSSVPLDDGFGHGSFPPAFHFCICWAAQQRSRHRSMPAPVKLDDIHII